MNVTPIASGAAGPEGAVPPPASDAPERVFLPWSPGPQTHPESHIALAARTTIVLMGKSVPVPGATHLPLAFLMPPANPQDDPPLGPAALQAPWRLEYLESIDAKEKASAGRGAQPLSPAPQASSAPSTGSFLRDYWLTPENDVTNHVIIRTGEGLILLNAYPYANGHLLVALGDARPTLLDYEPGQRAALWRLTELATDLLQRTLEPQGINLGINQGRAAGAGVPQHLHVHLVPRWNGDVNFISTVGQVRVIPSSLEAMAARFRRAWQAMQEAQAKVPST